MNQTGAHARCLAVVAAVVISCGACAASNAATTHASAAGARSAKSTTSSPPPSEPVETPKTKVPIAADPLAPQKYRVVQRGGKIPSPRVAGHVGAFAKGSPVVYPDGLKLTVTGVSQGVEAGKGPGLFPGRPHTRIALRFENQTRASLDLNQVVVTTQYGLPARVAAPVYNDSVAKDFAGTLKPGASEAATYAFAIPSTALGTVVTFVDFDGVHVAARFTGPAR